VSLSGDARIDAACDDEWYPPDVECGDDVLSVNNGEWCDGTDDTRCEGICTTDCYCGTPSNPTCETAIAVATLPFTDIQPTGEHDDTWYSFTAPKNGTLVLHDKAGAQCGGSFCVYSGACGSLSEVDCSPFFNFPPRPATLSVPVVGGQGYYVLSAPDNACNAAGVTLSIK
jgi:hypothetical protein